MPSTCVVAPCVPPRSENPDVITSFTEGRTRRATSRPWRLLVGGAAKALTEREELSLRVARVSNTVLVPRRPDTLLVPQVLSTEPSELAPAD